jgi:TonB family protein
MENKLVKFSFLALALSSSYVSATEVSKHLTTIAEPVPIVRVNPKYPVKAAREGRSGWAKYSFVIEKNGRVSNIVEIDSSGSRDLSRAGLKALKKWKYKPAMENGEPIQQCVNTVQLDFTLIRGMDGVKKRFMAKYKLAVEAYSAKEYSRLEEYITEMEDSGYRDVTENNMLHALSAEYAGVIGNKKKQLDHLTSIHFSATTEKEIAYKISILNKRFVLSVELNKLRSAYSIYNQLKAMDGTEEYLARYDNIIAKMDAFIDSPQEIIVDANISNRDFWRYRLVRNEFSLANIEGRLSKLDIRCANKRHVYSVEDNNTWKIPKAWKNCSILVYGEDNASFKLIEHAVSI